MDWDAWIAGMTPERANVVRWFVVQMRTQAGIEETVNAMMAALNVLDRPGGRELADRLAREAQP